MKINNVIITIINEKEMNDVFIQKKTLVSKIITKKTIGKLKEMIIMSPKEIHIVIL